MVYTHQLNTSLILRIILDGDLDTAWIESMNSVMDDNKILTLASNERIPLLAHMRLIFEIRDLRFATPATVSRAGIIYVSDGRQWYSYCMSWINTMKHLREETRQSLIELFERYEAIFHVIYDIFIDMFRQQLSS